MASISNRANGSRIIEFVDPDGARRKVYLAQTPYRDAIAIKVQIERILTAKLAGSPVSQQTALWLSQIGDKLRQKLVTAGLIEPSGAAVTLGPFLDQYIKRRTDLKERTRDIFERTKFSLIAYFTAGKRLQDITEGDVKDFRVWLGREGSRKGTTLAKNTVNDRCRKAKQMFASAVDHRLIARNPFAALKGITVRSNPDRFAYVTPADALKVMDAAGDADLKLVIALCRFAGLRNPSETLNLRWENVDLPAGRMTVDSPKTEHHDGKAYRVVPIFPEVRPLLESAWDRLPDGEGSEFVISSWRSQNKNMRTRLLRAIRRAGLTAWQKPFQNLRSSCQTDLEERFPSHVVCAWLGNSERVAREHYLQVTESHFERASKPAPQSVGESVGNVLTQTVSELHRLRDLAADATGNHPIPRKSIQCKDLQYTPQGSNLQPPVP